MRIRYWSAAVLAGCLGATSVAAAPAGADELQQQPFAQSSPSALIARPDASGRTQLYQKDLSRPDGSLMKVGSPWQGNGSTTEYNALGFNPTDGFAYAIANAWGAGDRSLVRVDRSGVAVVLGAVSGPFAERKSFVNNGTIVDGKHLLVISRGDQAVYSIDLATRVSTRIALSDTWIGSDAVSIGDPNVIWSLYDGDVQRADLTTGVVTTWRGRVDAAATHSGGIFAYPNGDIGVSADTGVLTRFRVSGAATADPTFTVASTEPAPASSTADAAAIGERSTVHQPFDRDKPLGFWASVQPAGTQLYTVDVTAPDSPLKPLGPIWTGTAQDRAYNAIAFNKADGYIYGITDGSQSLVRIGNDGSVVRLSKIVHPDGHVGFLNNGMIVDGKLIAVYNRDSVMLSIDLKTGAAQRTDLSATWEVADFTTNDGVYAWGMHESKIQRLTIATGEVRTFSHSVPGGVLAGGILNAGNGDFLVGDNGRQGILYRVHIADPASDRPEFTVRPAGAVPTTVDADATSTVGTF